MTRDEALARLRAIAELDDPEEGHIEADEILLALIGDDEISEAWNDLRKWYA